MLLPVRLAIALEIRGNEEDRIVPVEEHAVARLVAEARIRDFGEIVPSAVGPPANPGNGMNAAPRNASL